MENLFETLDVEDQLRVTQKVVSELKEENEMLLKALVRVNKDIDDQKLNDRFGHTQTYIREAIAKAQDQ